MAALFVYFSNVSRKDSFLFFKGFDFGKEEVPFGKVLLTFIVMDSSIACKVEIISTEALEFCLAFSFNFFADALFFFFVISFLLYFSRNLAHTTQEVRTLGQSWIFPK